jgi:Tfp pilus assembly protein PilF
MVPAWQPHLRRLALAGILLLDLTGATAAPTSDAAIKHFQAAARHADEGALSAAVIDLKNALQQDPDYAEARLLLGKVYLRLGDGVTAEKELRRAQDLGEDRARASVPLATALLLQGRSDQVLSEINSQTFTGEAATEALLLRADAHAGLGQVDEARALHNEAVEKHRDRGAAVRARALKT